MVETFKFISLPGELISLPNKYVKYEDYEKLKDAVLSYITVKIMLTDCMQDHFRLVCNKCPKYYTCKVYEAHYFAWQDLQKAVKEAKP